MASVTRKTSKTIATVSASSRKVSVTINESLTIEESRELRGLLKAAEKTAGGQSAFSYGGLLSTPLAYSFNTRY